jgi:hypothetical protein
MREAGWESRAFRRFARIATCQYCLFEEGVTRTVNDPCFDFGFGDGKGG